MKWIEIRSSLRIQIYKKVFIKSIILKCNNISIYNNKLIIK